MSVEFDVLASYKLESANHITFIEPGLHPDRTLPYHDFLYITDGTWEIVEEGKTYHVSSDDLLILSAGRHHYGEMPCSANNRHMYIHAYVPASVEGERQDVRKFASLIHCQNNPRVKELFEEVIQAVWSDDPLKERRQSLLFGLLLCELHRQQEYDGLSGSDMVREVTREILTNPQVMYSAGEMAEKFFVCAKTLNNQFRKVHGKTFYTYQMEHKLEMVRQFLRNHPDTKLEEVARNFGFCDEFHLGKVYKKKYGISPKRHVRGGQNGGAR